MNWAIPPVGPFTLHTPTVQCVVSVKMAVVPAMRENVNSVVAERMSRLVIIPLPLRVPTIPMVVHRFSVIKLAVDELLKPQKA